MIDLGYLRAHLDAHRAEQDLVDEKVTNALDAIERLKDRAQQVRTTVDGDEARRLAKTIADGEYPLVWDALSELAKAVPAGKYYKYEQKLDKVMQQAALEVMLLEFFTTGRVATKEEAAASLKVPVHEEGTVYLTTEAYLHAMINFVGELARLSVTRIVFKDIETPYKCHAVGTEIQNAFSVLNLKNDGLRRHFDTLKYSVRRLEDVIYDLSVRGIGGEEREGKRARNE